MLSHSCMRVVDRGGGDDHHGVPGPLPALHPWARPPAALPVLHPAAHTWQRAHPGHTGQQGQHTFPGNTLNYNPLFDDLWVSFTLTFNHLCQLGTVSLALFRTLIGLFCEDVMLQLVFRSVWTFCPNRKRFLASDSAVMFAETDQDPASCPQVSDSLQPPDQEAALLLKAEGLLLLQRCLIPAPHALLVPWEPGQHKCTLRTPHPLAQRSRSVRPTHLQYNHLTYLYANFNSVSSDLSVSDSVGYCRGSDFLMDVNYLHYLWDARQAISTSHRSVSTSCPPI